MKKKLIFCILIILIIAAIVVGIKKKRESDANYEISQVKIFNYLKYYENQKYGVIDKNGSVVIPAEYKDVVIPNPQEDMFVCYSEDEKTEVLNAESEKLFTDYEKVEPIKLKNVASVLCYEKSVLAYQKDGLYGLIDYSGKQITKNKYSSIENLQSTEGKLLVKENEKYGVINIKGTTLIKTKYDNIKTDGYYEEDNQYVKSGYIVSNKTDDGYKYGYVDYTGKELLKPEYSDMMRIEELEDIYLIAANNGKYGLYKKSKEILKPEYQAIVYNDNGLLTLQRNRNYGMADLKGNMKIDLNYTDIEIRGIYIYASNVNENVVYDVNGNKQNINFNKSIYETENDNYRISTMVNNNITYYGIEDKNENVLLDEGHRYIEYVFNDYFIAKNEDGKVGVINSKGETLVDFKYSLIQKIKGKNMLQLINDKNNKTYIYSSELQEVCVMKKAIIDNQDEFIKISNNKEEKYFDNNGNEISADSEIVRRANLSKLPYSVGEYIKTQYSLDNAFYVKK